VHGREKKKCSAYRQECKNVTSKKYLHTWEINGYRMQVRIWLNPKLTWSVTYKCSRACSLFEKTKGTRVKCNGAENFGNSATVSFAHCYPPQKGESYREIARKVGFCFLQCDTWLNDFKPQIHSEISLAVADRRSLIRPRRDQLSVICGKIPSGVLSYWPMSLLQHQE